MSAPREDELDNPARFRKVIENALRKAGIAEGHDVLDCCCGSGNYTVPAAMLVGDQGVVYAVDENETRLQQLSREAESRGLRNVRVITSNVEHGIPLPDDAVDFVLLYDIFWYFRPAEKKTGDLLAEVRRVAKANSVVSVYPTHVGKGGLERFIEQIQEAGFGLLNEFSSRLVHDGSVVTGTLLNYGLVTKGRINP